jgi:DNA-binding NtrC family response regulator
MPRTTDNADTHDRAPRLVAVVEDDTNLRETIAAYLERHGFTVARAANGLEALLEIKRVRPTAVVLDLCMPRLGGLEALRHIRAFDTSIRVVVISGALNADLRGQALALGASVVMEKPMTLDALLSALTEAPSSSGPAFDAPKAVTEAGAAPPAFAGQVLVVDDEADVRALLEDFLTPKGYRVRSVVNGAAALREVIDEAPDVVLLDIDMPRFGGIEALTAIQRLAPAVKVVMISGKASVDAAKLSLAYGAFDYIRKPFDLDHLGEVIVAALLWKR